MITSVGGHTFELLTGCTCPGYKIEYECTTSGIGSKVWHGTAFKCPSREITLRHSQYSSGNLKGECNNGDICAHALVAGLHINQYTSRLIVNVTSSLDGQSISCSYDDGITQFLVNTSVLTLTTGTQCLCC